METIKQQLKKLLTPSRYRHCVHVAHTARQLALQHVARRAKQHTVLTADEKRLVYRAELAGLLHDCAKDIVFSPSRKTHRAIDTTKIPHYDFLVTYAPGVIHSFASAQVAEGHFGIHDQRVLRAIARHTTAARTMTLLDMIVYLADMIEPSRQYKHSTYLRALAYRDINAAYAAALAAKLCYLIEHNCVIVPATIEAYNHIQCKMQNA